MLADHIYKAVKMRLRTVENHCFGSAVHVHLCTGIDVSKGAWIYMPDRTGVEINHTSSGVNFTSGIRMDDTSTTVHDRTLQSDPRTVALDKALRS